MYVHEFMIQNINARIIELSPAGAVKRAFYMDSHILKRLNSYWNFCPIITDRKKKLYVYI
jgi:hypothetical protein